MCTVEQFRVGEAVMHFSSIEIVFNNIAISPNAYMRMFHVYKF